MRDRRHGRRHRKPAVPRSDPPARQRARPRARDVRPSDPGAVDPLGRRAEDQADAAFGQGAARRSASSPTSCSAAATGRSRRARARRSRCSAICAKSRVIPALDVDTIYDVPSAYHAEGFDREVCAHFGLDAPEPDLGRWDAIVNRIRQPEGEVTIAIVGKYTHLPDSYKSLAEALAHGGIANNVRVKLDWIDTRDLRGRSRRGAASRGRARHPRARRVRRARHRGQDRGGALRPRAPGALFRHLLRHADGGDRGGAPSRRAERRRLDRVRPVRSTRSSG